MTDASPRSSAPPVLRKGATVQPLFPAVRLLKANLWGLTEAVEAVRGELQGVRADIDRLRRECDEEIKKRRTELEREVEDQRRSAYQEGLGEGRQALSEILTQITTEFAALQTRCAESVQRLAFQVARKILDIEFQIRPESVVDLVRQVLEKARFCRDVTIVVHPDDCELLSRMGEELRARLITAEQLRIRADLDVPRHAVRLETNRGVRDGSLDQQFARLLEYWFQPSGKASEAGEAVGAQV